MIRTTDRQSADESASVSNVVSYWKAPAGGLYIPSPTRRGVFCRQSVGQRSQDTRRHSFTARALRFTSVRPYCFSNTPSIDQTRHRGLRSALIFAIHPCQVETVAWASGLRTCSADFFRFCDLVISARTRVAIDSSEGEAPAEPEDGTAADAARLESGPLISGDRFVVLAMLCKPTAVVVPAMLALIELVFLRSKPLAVVRSLWIWFALLIPILIVADSRRKTGEQFARR